MEGLGERLPPKVLDHCLHLAQDLLSLLFLGTLFRVRERSLFMGGGGGNFATYCHGGVTFF